MIPKPYYENYASSSNEILIDVDLHDDAEFKFLE